MSIRFKTKSGVRLRTLFETVSPLLVEGTIEFTKDEMRIRGSSTISFCDARIFADEEDVSEYVYDWPTESYSIGVSFETVHSCLSAVSPNDTVTFFISQENQNDARPHVTVSISNSDVGYCYEDSIYLLMLETQVLDDSDKLESFEKLVSMSSSLLLRVLRNSAKRSDETQIYTRRHRGEEKIYFRSSGDDASLLFSLRYETDEAECEEDATECLKMDVYSLKFLLLITKATNLSSTVRIYLKDKHYLAINYKLGSRSSVLFCLAPQVERAADCPLTQLEQAKEAKVNEEEEKIEIAAVTKTTKFKRPVKRRRKRVETASPMGTKEANKRIKTSHTTAECSKRKRVEAGGAEVTVVKRTKTS